MLQYSEATIAVVRIRAVSGMSRTADLQSVVVLVGRWEAAEVELRFGWVKSYMGIAENLRADDLANVRWLDNGPHKVMKRVMRALWKRLQARERSIVGFGVCRVSC